MAKIEGYSERTINRAKKELKITSYKDSDEDGNNVWFWKRKTKREEAYSKKLHESLSKLNLPKLPFSD